MLKHTTKVSPLESLKIHRIDLAIRKTFFGTKLLGWAKEDARGMGYQCQWPPTIPPPRRTPESILTAVYDGSGTKWEVSFDKAMK